MARAAEHEEAVNADSFLDIVASVVSVMIIMVMMTGLKIKNTPIEAPPTPQTAEAGAELARELQDEARMRGDVHHVAAEIDSVIAETNRCQSERDMLAMAVNTLEGKIRGSRETQGQQAKLDAALENQLGDARRKLEDLERQTAAIRSAPAPAVQIENYPTPLATTVDGRELHFQLRGGRIAFIPLDTLLSQFKSDAEHKAYRLRDVPEMTDTLGPEGGFRLRYTLERHELTEEEAQELHHRGTAVSLKRWTLIPVADDLGEPVDQALQPNSQFHQSLYDPRARGAAVTIWTYSDSFDAFRKIKKDLYALKYPVAARPMPDGAPISGSPHGSKSTAE